MKRLFVFMTVCSLLFIPASGHASDEIQQLKSDMQELKNMFHEMKDMYETKIDVLQMRIDQLEGQNNKLSVENKSTDFSGLQAQVDRPEQEKMSSDQGIPAILDNMNPQISVLGDFVYHTTDEDGGELDNDFNFREAEIAFSANVDTYARGDMIVAIENEEGETEVALEEGYLTLLETPVDNLQGKFGKFRPYFGKTNKMHLHALPWTTYPDVVRNFLGEEGFSDAGVSVNYLIPNPTGIFSEMTFEAFNNNDTAVFGAGEEGETVYLGHWKNFLEITDDTSVELGGSYMTGDNANGGGADSHVSGFDLTLNSQLLEKLRTTSHTEALFSKIQQPGEDDLDAWGMFSSLEQQINQRWWAFGRYDYSQMPDDSSLSAHAYSTGLTFAQSEYAFWRVMFTHTDNHVSEDSNEVWLQLDFGIGPHRPHQYR